MEFCSRFILATVAFKFADKSHLLHSHDMQVMHFRIKDFKLLLYDQLVHFIQVDGEAVTL
jgi:hypothetical protein